MNKDQTALLEWITAGLQISEVRSLHGDAAYLLNNMIAKYSLAASEYLLSGLALERLQNDGFDMSRTYKRSRFYGKKSLYIYEHTMPASLVRNQLLKVNPTRGEVEAILSTSGPVAMVLREEDDQLRINGLRSKMPVGWEWGDDALARYHAAGLRIATQKISVEGAICR